MSLSNYLINESDSFLGYKIDFYDKDGKRNLGFFKSTDYYYDFSRKFKNNLKEGLKDLVLRSKKYDNIKYYKNIVEELYRAGDGNKTIVYSVEDQPFVLIEFEPEQEDYYVFVFNNDELNSCKRFYELQEAFEFTNEVASDYEEQYPNDINIHY